MPTSFIPITSSDRILGETIIDHIDVVYGNTVRAKHVGRDIMAGLKTVGGGEIHGYTEMLGWSANTSGGRRMSPTPPSFRFRLG